MCVSSDFENQAPSGLIAEHRQILFSHLTRFFVFDKCDLRVAKGKDDLAVVNTLN